MTSRKKYYQLSRRSLLTYLSALGATTYFSNNILVFAANLNINNSFSDSREKWRYQLIGTPEIWGDARSQVIEIIEEAKKYLRNYLKDSNRLSLWPDLNLENKTSYADSDKVSQTINRILTITKAYKLNTFQSDNEKALTLALIRDALKWVSDNIYNVKTVRYGNWYDWDISIPQYLNNILIIMDDEIDKQLIKSIIQAERVLTPVIPREGTYAAAANSVLFCDSISGRAILSDNQTEVDEVKTRLGELLQYANSFDGPVGLTDGNKNEAAFFSHDGFYRDGSFIQHGQFPYIGNYGIAFLNSLALVLNRLPGEKINIDIINKWIRDSVVPWIWRGAVIDSVIGRGVAQPDIGKSRGLEMISTLLLLYKQISGEDKQSLSDFLKKQLLHLRNTPTYFNKLPLSSIQDINSILANENIFLQKSAPSYLVFSAMDRTLYRTESWAVSFAMNSWRMANYETGGNENLRGWYQSDGATFLYTDDQEKYDNGYWCTINSYHLPGTTTERVSRKAEAKPWRTEYHNPTFCAGGTTAKTWGSAIFTLKAEAPSTIQTKISRFFFEDCYVCVGSAITTSDNRLAQTTVENSRLTKKLTDGIIINGSRVPVLNNDKDIIKDINYIFVDDYAGYQFFQGEELAVYLESNSGAPSDISKRLDNEDGNRIYTNTFLNIIINHTISLNAKYAYAVYPAIKLETFKKLDDTPDIEILKNDEKIHCIRQKSSQRMAVNIFSAHSDKYISVSGLCSILFEYKEKYISIFISNPNQDNRVIDCILFGLGDKRQRIKSTSDKLSCKQENNNLIIQFDSSGLTGETKNIIIDLQGTKNMTLYRFYGEE